MQNQFFYNGSSIFYRLSGNGFPVVLLHGFAEDGSIWSEQIGYLEQHCRLIVPDLPGSGQSEILLQETVGIDDYASCIQALLMHEGIEHYIVLGHSLGGYISLAFAEMFPDKVQGIGLVHSTAFADNADKKTARKRGIALIEEYGASSFIKNTTPNLFAEKYKKLHSDRISGLIAHVKDISKETLIQYYTAMMNRRDRTGVLQKSTCPVLFVLGDEDVAAPLNDLLQQVHLPKIAYIHLLKGVGHMGLWEAADELNTHLLAFVKDVYKQEQEG